MIIRFIFSDAWKKSHPVVPEDVKACVFLQCFRQTSSPERRNAIGRETKQQCNQSRLADIISQIERCARFTWGWSDWGGSSEPPRTPLRPRLRCCCPTFCNQFILMPPNLSRSFESVLSNSIGMVLKVWCNYSSAYSYPTSKIDVLLWIALARYFPPAPVM